jgi:hypothetical protein
MLKVNSYRKSLLFTCSVLKNKQHRSNETAYLMTISLRWLKNSYSNCTLLVRAFSNHNTLRCVACAFENMPVQLSALVVLFSFDPSSSPVFVLYLSAINTSLKAELWALAGGTCVWCGSWNFVSVFVHCAIWWQHWFLNVVVHYYL